MADWSLLGGGADCKALVVTAAASEGLTLASGGSANTKIAWTEIIASLDSPVEAILVSFAVSTFDYLFDIGIGSAGSEIVVAENLYAGNGTVARLLQPYFLPLRLAAGVRVSVRFQSSGATAPSPIVSILALRGVTQSASSGRIVTYGASTSDSGGVSIDPGTSANTKGAWIELTASTTGAAKGFVLAFGGNGDSTRSTCKWLVDVAVGASGSEQIIVGDLQLASRTEHDTVLPQVMPMLPIAIPAGARIAVRAQCDITTAGDRLFDVFLYAME